VAAIYGGIEMYFLRESNRAAGAPLQFPALWLDRCVDVLAGALFQLVFLLGAAWLVSILMDDANVWLRQSTVVVVYLALAAYVLFT
jgi:hypothetical protein